jgi:hypothetical protein
MPRVAAQPTADIQGALKAALVKIKEAEKKDALIEKLQAQVAKLKGGAAAAAAPAKRGRPAKSAAVVDVPVSKRVKAADVADAPKRRGRPPKAEAAPVVSEAPKRRGRPPKAAAVEAAPAKKVAAKAAPAKAKRASDDDYLL